MIHLRCMSVFPFIYKIDGNRLDTKVSLIYDSWMFIIEAREMLFAIHHEDTADQTLSKR